MMMQSLMPSLDSRADLWADTMWRACWQGALFIGILWIVCRLTPRLPASTRCLLWGLASLKLVLGLTGAFNVPLAPSRPLQEAVPAAQVGARPDLTTAAVSPSHPGKLSPPPTGHKTTVLPSPVTAPQAITVESDIPLSPDRHVGFLRLCMLVWLLGVMLHFVFAISQFTRAAWILRKTEMLTNSSVNKEAASIAKRLGYRRTVPLRVSDAVSGPVVVGLLHPTIVLPRDGFEGLPEPQRALALSHEFAHLRRGDLWLSLIPALAQALFWFHPLVWLAVREFKHCREAACDAEALQVTGESPAAYGELLLGFLSVRQTSPLPFGLSATSGYQELHRRLTMLQTLTLVCPPLRRPHFILLLTISALGLLPWRLVAAPQSTDDPLAGNSRLDRKVTLSVEGMPVGELLSLLSAKTGVRMEARPIVADDKVILFDTARPLREVMSDLAVLFNDAWLHGKTDSGTEYYALTRFGRAQDYEASLAALPIARIAAQLEAQVHALSETPEQLAQRPKNDPIRIRLADAGIRLTTQLYAGLSPEQRDRLFAQTTLTIPFATLAPSQQAEARKQYNAWLARARQQQLEEHSPIIERDFDRQGITFSVRQLFGSLSVYADPLGEIGTFSSRMQWALPPHGNPYTQKPIPANAVLPDSKTVATAQKEGDWIDRLRMLAATTGQTVMADYYRSKPVTRPTEDPSDAINTASPLQSLDALCAPDGYLWWTHGTTLLVRKRDWYLQTQYEPSDAWLLALQKRLHAQNSVPTHDDMFSILGLPLRKIVGLVSLKFRDNPADTHTAGEYNEHEMAGWPEFLMLAKTLCSRPDAPMMVYQGIDLGPANVIPFEGGALGGDQQTLLTTYLDRQADDVASARTDRFRMILYRDVDQPTPDAPKPMWVQVNVQLDSWPKDAPPLASVDQIHRLAISLPLELPDDRRDRTRIELFP